VTPRGSANGRTRAKGRGRATCWSYTAGQYPSSVEVHERAPGGVLYARAWDPALKRQVRRSLRHRDREAARQYAEAEAKKLRAGLAALPPAATVGGVLNQYLLHATPLKQAAPSRSDDRRRAELWVRVLGAERRVATLGAAEWWSFIRDRSAGIIDARGARIAKADARAPVGPRTVDADLVFLIAVFNWALGWKVQGRPLLDLNPWAAPAPGVKRTLARPTNPAPMRPIATYDRYLAVCEAAPRVLMLARRTDPEAHLVTTGTKRHGARRTEGPKSRYLKPSYLPELLELIEQTGRRISAICQLRADDIRRNAAGEITALRWRPMKRHVEQVVPVSPETRATLERVLRSRSALGAVPLFPSYRDPARAIAKRQATAWLVEAEQLAKVPHLAGGSWHPYRRKWATERKHLPRRDVKEAGGWTDERSLANCYEGADEETMMAVVTEPRKLLERRASAGASGSRKT